MKNSIKVSLLKRLGDNMGFQLGALKEAEETLEKTNEKIKQISVREHEAADYEVILTDKESFAQRELKEKK